jgi:hypothetical protein
MLRTSALVPPCSLSATRSWLVRAVSRPRHIAVMEACLHIIPAQLRHSSGPLCALDNSLSPVRRSTGQCARMHLAVVCSACTAAEIADAEAAGEELLPLPVEPTLSEVLEEGLSRLQTEKNTWKVCSLPSLGCLRSACMLLWISVCAGNCSCSVGICPGSSAR